LRNKKFVIIALTIIFLLTNNHKLKADYINLTGAQLSSTIAEYYVDDDDGSGDDKFELDLWFYNPFIALNFTF